ncbi:MAG: peptidylprolyl isomerase [Acidobacteriota bacterium]
MSERVITDRPLTVAGSTRFRPLTGLVLVLALAALAPRAVDAQVSDRPAPLLPMSSQIALRESWLPRRYDLLLRLLRAHNVGMWIVVNEEFHDDPLTWLVAPPRPYVGRRDVFVFIDAGETGLKRIAATGYAEESVQRFFDSPSEPAPPEKVLASLVAQYQPKTIALGINGTRGVTRSLTYDAHTFIVSAIGPEAAARIVSAEPLIEELLDTRSQEERAHYTLLVEWTEHLARRALSNEVITPGVTTVGDVRRWLFDQSHRTGLVPWFQPDLRIQRRSTTPPTSRTFLAVAKEAVVIEPGDVVHLDFGVDYLGLASDWQKMAYVLRPGETDVPEGLKKALANTHALQDALARLSRPGKAAGAVHDETMADMKARGITARIYSHPLGHQGHALGASIDGRAATRDAGKPPRLLRRGSYLAMELNTETPVPEWDGQIVTVMAEDPVYLTDEGWQFFRPRQEAWYLIRSGVELWPSLGDGLYADLSTNKGHILLRLEFEKTPMTVANFVGLAEGTIENRATARGIPFFDGTIFHRVVPGHVIQAGMPRAATRSPGHVIPNEIDLTLSHARAGMLGMANAGPHSATCQFYITLGDRSYLDGNYTLFGSVVSGMDVVNAIVQGDIVNHVRIMRVGEKARAFRPDTASFRAMVADLSARLWAEEARKAREEEAEIQQAWPAALRSPGGARYLVDRAGAGEPPKTGDRITIAYTGRFLDGRRFCSSADDGRPTFCGDAEPFPYVVGKSRVTPAVDEAAAAMRPGERRTVIAPASLGYGTAGFTAREVPGQKRFVISPNTILVYEIEVIR